MLFTCRILHTGPGQPLVTNSPCLNAADSNRLLERTILLILTLDRLVMPTRTPLEQALRLLGIKLGLPSLTLGEIHNCADVGDMELTFDDGPKDQC